VHANALSSLTADAWHFFIKEFLAAPTSGLPFLLTAFTSQLAAPLDAATVFVVDEAEVCAKAMFAKNKIMTTAREDLLITHSLKVKK
jgi:hypothetical protein